MTWNAGSAKTTGGAVACTPPVAVEFWRVPVARLRRVVWLAR